MKKSKISLRMFRVSGFKALERATFQIPNRSLVLIGSNGSGKSSTLQALGLVREFACGNATKFFDDRGWTPTSVRSSIGRNPFFRADLLFDNLAHGKFLWQFDWGLGTRSNRREVIWHLAPDSERPARILDYSRNRTMVAAQKHRFATGLKLPGSALAYLEFDREEQPYSGLFEVVEWAQQIISLELLSPTAMRRGARGATDNIGIRGERLASFLASLDSKSKDATVRRLRKFYPLKGIETTRKRAGWVDMRISESFRQIGGFGPSHASDGLLRLMAICAIPEFSPQTSLVMLDEIEDGIEPHILPELIMRVVSDSCSQIILTSHSPLLVNFFGPKDIHVMARTKDGLVVTTQFSDLDDWREGLEFLGPGELWSMSEREGIGRRLANKGRSAEEKQFERIARFSLREAQTLFMCE